MCMRFNGITCPVQGCTNQLRIVVFFVYMFDFFIETNPLVFAANNYANINIGILILWVMENSVSITVSCDFTVIIILAYLAQGCFCIYA